MLLFKSINNYDITIQLKQNLAIKSSLYWHHYQLMKTIRHFSLTTTYKATYEFNAGLQLKGSLKLT